MSSRRGEKKRLKSEDPRKQSRTKTGTRTGAGAKKTPRYRIDGATLALSVIAVVLVVLVVFMLIRRPGAGRSAGMAAAGSEPVIERVENRETVDVEPVPELGTPEARVEPDPEEAAPPEDTPAPEAGDATARLFFVKVTDEGKIGMKSVLRQVPSTGSPLTTAIESLIEGPRPGELSNDVLSLVPEEASLLGARVEGGVAFLDFSEDFRFNKLGIEGYQAQVEQVVYTATEFSTVDKVQFLVEGQRIDFLGGEGFYVGAPLGREDF